MPWIDKIHLVTNGQKPSFLTEEFIKMYNTILVTHEQIFKGYEQFLPVFNSQTIEAMLWNIPQLSEDFIYFNDDFFVVSPVKKIDFFDSGKFVYRGMNRFKNKWLGRVQKHLVPGFKKGIIDRRAESADFPHKLWFYSPAHAPYTLNSCLLKEAVTNWGINDILSYRFRNDAQPWPVGLFINQIAKRNLLTKSTNNDWLYFFPTHDRSFSIKLTPNIKFFCAQLLDSLPNGEQKYAIEFLNSLLD